jgi:hypothetical protein
MMKALSWQERQGALAVELARSADSLAALAGRLTVHRSRSELLGRVAVRLLRSAERLADLSHHLGARRPGPRVARHRRPAAVERPTVPAGRRLVRT